MAIRAPDGANKIWAKDSNCSKRTSFIYAYTSLILAMLKCANVSRDISAKLECEPHLMSLKVQCKNTMGQWRGVWGVCLMGRGRGMCLMEATFVHLTIVRTAPSPVFCFAQLLHSSFFIDGLLFM